MPKQNTAFCLLFLLCTPFSTMFLLYAVDLLGMLGKPIKDQKFPLLKSLISCISEAWLQSCVHTPSHFSLSGAVQVPDSVWDCTMNGFHTPSVHTAAMHQGIRNRDNIIKGYYQQTTHRVLSRYSCLIRAVRHSKGIST